MSAIMTTRQSAELDHAFERNGWTADDVKAASKGDLLAQLLIVVRGRAKVVVNSILTFLRTVRVVAHTATTTSKEYFAEAGVKWTGSNFESQFFGLEVAETPEAELAVRKLEEDSLDAPIMAELGDKVETSVSHFADFLGSHRESKEVFIFYLRGRDGNLWAVSADWRAGIDGWDVHARSVTDPDRWHAGDQVVSRN